MNDFETKVCALQPKLLSVALKLTGSRREDSEDLVQQTILSALRKRHTYIIDGNLNGWLYQILMRKFINLYRSKQRLNSRIAHSSDLNSIVGDEIIQPLWHSDKDNPEFQLERKELRARIEEAISLLDPKFKKAAEMRFFHDSSYEDISQEIKVDIGTVKSRIHRARRDLRPLLKIDRQNWMN